MFNLLKYVARCDNMFHLMISRVIGEPCALLQIVDYFWNHKLQVRKKHISRWSYQLNCCLACSCVYSATFVTHVWYTEPCHSSQPLVTNVLLISY